LPRKAKATGHELPSPALASAGKGKATKSVTLHLPQPHPRQFDLLSSFEPGVRFVVGACGTKFGKTYGCSIWLVEQAWTNKNSFNWWVAPSYAQSKIAYDLVLALLPQGTFVEYKADLRIQLIQPDGSLHSRIEFKSADDPSKLRGYAVNAFVLDEAAIMQEAAFVSVMTTVTQTRGIGLIISTPKGRGWFFDVYNRGEKFEDDGVTPRFDEKHKDPFPEWMAIRMPTWTNPHVQLDAVREAKNNLPEDVFRQEFAAQFLDDTAGVFRGVSNCLDVTQSTFSNPQPGHRYSVGVDLARLRDYSVITVIDRQTKRLVYMERFNQISWEVQYHRIIRVARQYPGTLTIDSTGIGDPIVQTIQNSGVTVTPYKIGGSASKQQLIEKLRVGIESRQISFPRNRDTLILVNELKVYQYSFTDSGIIKYEAPSGKHDDCVISLALAYMGADSPDWSYRSWNQRSI
jgi:terminase large subunit-like protein